MTDLHWLRTLMCYLWLIWWAWEGLSDICKANRTLLIRDPDTNLQGGHNVGQNNNVTRVFIT